MTGAARHRTGVRIVLVYVVKLNQAVTGADGLTEEVFDYAELTRELAPGALVIDTLFHFAP